MSAYLCQENTDERLPERYLVLCLRSHYADKQRKAREANALGKFQAQADFAGHVHFVPLSVNLPLTSI